MDKKLTAIIVIGLFFFGTFAITAPVQAHFTLGDLTGTYRYHSNDFDPHIPGVIGYVWPGGGLNTYTGSPNLVSVNNAPGYQSPYPGGNPAGAPTTSWYQLEGDTYAPFGAILAGSTGDLIFALNATACSTQGAEPTSATTCNVGGRFTGRWQGVDILLPPGFAVPGSPQVVSTITNDYSSIAVARIAPDDRYAPGWTLVRVLAEAGMDANAPLGTRYYDHQGIDFTTAGEWYYVRINGVLAPSVAGRYFFKILLEGGSRSICDVFGFEQGTGFGAGSLPGGSCSEFIPTQNWPVLLVKGEIDPAILTGTVRYAGYNATLYGQPIGEAGKVWAKMTMRLDPYTGQQRPDLPLVDAVGYFNATASGHFEVEGLAPGIYDLYASAAGFPQTLVQTGFTVAKGQSLHFDVYLQPGPVIHGNVFTKHQFGDEPWPLGDTGAHGFKTSGAVGALTTTDVTGADVNGQYIKIELYDSPTVSHIPISNTTLVSWSPLPCVAGGQEFYTGTYTTGSCNDPRLGSNIAFPWHEYTPANGYGVPSAASAPTIGYYRVSAGGQLGSGQYFGDNMQDPMGVGPPQHWFVQGGTTTPFHFEFGVKGEYGAPRDLDGMVPQVYATWVNGLTAGRYYVRAWTFRYVQSALDGSTFQEYYFDITPNEWAGDVTLPLDLRLSSWVNKTVYFHDVVNGITTDPIDTGAGVMSGVLADANGQTWSYNQTLLGYEGLYTTGARSGWQAAAFDTPITLRHENDLDKAGLNKFAIETGRANIQFWGWNDTWGGENYGLPSGTYTPHVYVLGYIEEGPVEQVSVTLSGNPTEISDHMLRGQGLNLTVYSIDWERPRVSRNWVWGQWGAGVPTGAPGACLDGTTTTTTTNIAGTATICNGQGGTAANGLYPFGAGFTGSPLGLPSSPGPGLTPKPPYNVAGSMVGQEIDIGIYTNGTLIDFIGDVPSNLQDTTPTSCLFQNDTASSVQMCGGGWSPFHPSPGTSPQVTAGATGDSPTPANYIAYDGNANDAYFGQELGDLGFVGGYSGGISYYTTKALLFAPNHFSPTTLADGGTYEQAVTGYTPLYPTALPGNTLYDLRAYTYGYIQDKSFSEYSQPTQVADMKINLIIGVNVSLQILFKKENIITPTTANMSARVRLFDDSGNLVAEWMSSEGTYSAPSSGFARAADGTTQYPFGPLHSAIPWPKQLNTYNYLPGGTTLLSVLMAGLPQVPAAGTDDGPVARYAPQGVYFNDPLFATTICGFEVDCYPAPGQSLGVGVPGYFPNTGILGAPDYMGGWSAEVDFVNWYNNNTATTTWTGLPFNPPTTPPPGTVVVNGANYYPPVSGLLMGESYHIIPGTTATSGISLTEDTALKPELVGHTIAPNHLGPYSQRGTWAISGTHNSGEASAIFEVDLNGFVSGNVLAFTWSNEFRPLSWGAITVTGAGLPSSGLNFYTYDGLYQAYLPVSTSAATVSYTFTLNAPGYAPYSWVSAVSVGQSATGQNVYLEQSNIPVPEFSSIAIIALAALAASVYLLRRRRL